MSYFCAVIGKQGSAWRALDVEVEDVESLDELAEHMRSAGHGEGPVLAVLEREDAWFALVRADAGSDEEPRTFVSDLDATEHSQFAGLLAPVADVDDDDWAELRAITVPADDDLDELEDEVDGLGGEDDVAPELDEEADAGPQDDSAGVDVVVASWAGDPGLLDDLGVTARELVELVVAAGDDPGSVLADVGERCGFDDQLDALR